MKVPERVLYLQERKRHLFLFPKRTMPTLEITEVGNLQSSQERSFDIKKTALNIIRKKI
jgi:hypothetical protein